MMMGGAGVWLRRVLVAPANSATSCRKGLAAIVPVGRDGPVRIDFVNPVLSVLAASTKTGSWRVFYSLSTRVQLRQPWH